MATWKAVPRRMALRLWEPGPAEPVTFNHTGDEVLAPATSVDATAYPSQCEVGNCGTSLGARTSAAGTLP